VAVWWICSLTLLMITYVVCRTNPASSVVIALCPERDVDG